MRKEFCIYKAFAITDVKDSSSDDTQWLGTVTGLVATTHKDLQGDILTHNFIKGTTKDLGTNRTVFYNHRSEQDPIAKVLDAKTKRLEEKSSSEMLDEKDTHHYGTSITIGFSKTAETQYQLVKEGILDKFSIGGFLLEYEFDEDKDAYIVDKGLVLEVSVVGIPANPKAEITDVFKQLRKDYQSKQKVNKDMEKNDIEDLFSKMLAKALANQKAEFEAESAEKVEKDVQKSEKDSLKTEIEKQEAKLTEIVQKNKELEEALAKKGRKTGKSHNTDDDPYFLEDEKMALYKGLKDFGDILAAGEPFKLELLPSTIQGRFKDIRI